MQHRLSVLGAFLAVPLMAMSSAPAVYLDEASEVAMPVCSLETCDAKPGHCEFDEGYHVPPPVEGVAVAVAREIDAGTSIVVADAIE